ILPALKVVVATRRIEIAGEPLDSATRGIGIGLDVGDVRTARIQCRCLDLNTARARTVAVSNARRVSPLGRGLVGPRLLSEPAKAVCILPGGRQTVRVGLTAQ